MNPIESRAGAKTALLRFAVLVCAVVAIALPASAQVVCLGASNTAGKGVLPGEAYPAQLEAMLQAKGYSIRVSNQGVSGDTTGGMLARLDTAVPAGTRVVILQPGANDRRQGVYAGRDANVAQIVDRLKARQIGVVMLDNELLQANPYHQSDGVHLTPEGYRLLALQLLPQVAAALGMANR